MNIITREHYDFLLSIGCPYEGYVEGLGYVSPEVTIIGKSNKPANHRYRIDEYSVQSNLTYYIINMFGTYIMNVDDLIDPLDKIRINIINKINEAINEYIGKSNQDIIPFELGVEWLTGRGPRYRHFKDGDTITEMLKRHEHIEEVRAKIKEHLRNKNPGNGPFPAPYALSGVQGVGKYIKDYSTLITAGATGNLAVTYIGSYNLTWEIVSVDHNTNVAIVRFCVENSSTMQSASRPPVIGYWPIWKNVIGKSINSAFDTGPGSITKQTFNWSETINF
jgi:hypothetical protein